MAQKAKIILEAETAAAERNIRKANRALKDTGASAKKTGASFKALAGAFTAALVGRQLVRGLQAVVKPAIDLELAMARLSAVGRVTGRELNMMGEAARAAAGRFIFGPQEMVETMATLQQFTADTAQSMALLDTTAGLAQISFGRLKPDAAAEAMGRLSKIVGQDAPRVANELIGLARQGGIATEKMAEQMGRLIQAASLGQQEITDMGQAFALIAKVEPSARRAGTLLIRLVSELKRGKAVEQFEAIGVQTKDFLTGQLLPITDILAQIARKNAQMPVETRRAIEAAVGLRGVRALTSALAILESNTAKGVDSFDEFGKAMQRSGGIIAEEVGKQSEVTAFKIRFLQEEVTKLAQDLGKPLLGPVKELAKGLKDVTTRIREFIGTGALGPMGKELLRATTILATVTAAAVGLGLVIAGLGAIFKVAIAFLASSVVVMGLLKGAVIALMSPLIGLKALAVATMAALSFASLPVTIGVLAAMAAVAAVAANSIGNLVEEFDSLAQVSRAFALMFGGSKHLSEQAVAVLTKEKQMKITTEQRLKLERIKADRERRNKDLATGRKVSELLAIGTAGFQDAITDLKKLFGEGPSQARTKPIVESVKALKRAAGTRVGGRFRTEGGTAIATQEQIDKAGQAKDDLEQRLIPNVLKIMRGEVSGEGAGQMITSTIQGLQHVIPALQTAGFHDLAKTLQSDVVDPLATQGTANKRKFADFLAKTTRREGGLLSPTLQGLSPRAGAAAGPIVGAQMRSVAQRSIAKPAGSDAMRAITGPQFSRPAPQELTAQSAQGEYRQNQEVLKRVNKALDNLAAQEAKLAEELGKTRKEGIKVEMKGGMDPREFGTSTQPVRRAF